MRTWDQREFNKTLPFPCPYFVCLTPRFSSGTISGCAMRAGWRATSFTATFPRSWAASARGRVTTWRTATRWFKPKRAMCALQTASSVPQTHEYCRSR
eukprot:6189519-Pleurochrysis_carterae.AAC.1